MQACTSHVRNIYVNVHQLRFRSVRGSAHDHQADRFPYSSGPPPGALVIWQELVLALRQHIVFLPTSLLYLTRLTGVTPVKRILLQHGI